MLTQKKENLSSKDKCDRIVYVVKGDPIPLLGKPARFQQITRIALEGQHPESQGIYRGPLALSIAFYIEAPRRNRPEHVPITPHIRKPYLTDLIRYIEDCCTSLLFEGPYTIASIQASKHYDSVPRTEFSLIEMK